MDAFSSVQVVETSSRFLSGIYPPEELPLPCAADNQFAPSFKPWAASCLVKKEDLSTFQKVACVAQYGVGIAEPEVFCRMLLNGDCECLGKTGCEIVGGSWYKPTCQQKSLEEEWLQARHVLKQAEEVNGTCTGVEYNGSPLLNWVRGASQKCCAGTGENACTALEDTRLPGGGSGSGSGGGSGSGSSGNGGTVAPGNFSDGSDFMALEVKVLTISYTRLKEKSAQLDDFYYVTKAVMANYLGVDAINVAVNLRAGFGDATASVIVNYKVYTHSKEVFDIVVGKVDTQEERSSLQGHLETHIKGVPGIGQVSTGVITVDDIGNPNAGVIVSDSSALTGRATREGISLVALICVVLSIHPLA